ncbi:unnamed protein product, partial [Mesorhabditis spiculigera]
MTAKTAVKRKGNAEATRPAKATEKKPKLDAGSDADEEQDKPVKTRAPRPVDEQQVLQGIQGQARAAMVAMKKHVEQKDQKSLFPDIDQAAELHVILKKTPAQCPSLRHKIRLPHTERTLKNTRVLVILPDLDRSQEARYDQDVDKQAREWEQKLEDDHGIRVGTHVTKVVTKRQLERENRQPVQKRQLSRAYDIFLVDSRVAKSVYTFLGKPFHMNKKSPQEFKYGRPLADAIQLALKSAYFYTLPRVERTHVEFGHFGQPNSQLGENFDALLAGVVKHTPGGLANIRGLYISPPSCTPFLQVYGDDGAASAVSMKKPLKKVQPTIVDECPSSRPARRVIREADNVAVLYPTTADEWEARDDLKPTINPEREANKRAKRHAKIEQDKKRKKAAKKAGGAAASGKSVVANAAGMLVPATGVEPKKEEVKEEQVDYSAAEAVEEPDSDVEQVEPPLKKAKKTEKAKKATPIAPLGEEEGGKKKKKLNKPVKKGNKASPAIQKKKKMNNNGNKDKKKTAKAR